MNAEQVKTVAEELRDFLTVKHVPLIYPMAFDVIAKTPQLCALLAERLSR